MRANRRYHACRVWQVEAIQRGVVCDGLLADKMTAGAEVDAWGHLALVDYLCHELQLRTHLPPPGLLYLEERDLHFAIPVHFHVVLVERRLGYVYEQEEEKERGRGRAQTF